MRSPYVIAVIESFEKLLIAVQDLCCTIEKDHKWPVWFSLPDTMHSNSLSSRQQLCYFIQQMEYIEGQQPREILIGPGLVPSSPITIQKAEYVNDCKLKFKEVTLLLKNSKLEKDENIINFFEDKLNNNRNRLTNVKKSFNKAGLARLHLKQCYRRIPILRRPERVAWTWANTRSIKKISKEEAKRRLEKHRSDQGIIMQLKKLSQIPDNEMLAVVQELAPHLRANIVFLNDGNVERKMIKGTMPIFYCADKNESLPSFIPPKQKIGKCIERGVRNDVKIAAKQFLPAIRAHRYLNSESIEV